MGLRYDTDEEVLMEQQQTMFSSHSARSASCEIRGRTHDKDVHQHPPKGGPRATEEEGQVEEVEAKEGRDGVSVCRNRKLLVRDVD